MLYYSIFVVFLKKVNNFIKNFTKQIEYANQNFAVVGNSGLGKCT